jgi:MFS transporter, DHA1 family, inner membrane transport protein
MPQALIALAVASFGIGTTEFVIMGLLPDVAVDLGVDIPSAGLLVTGYAAGVVIGAPLMAIATNGLPRKATLLGLVAIFVLGNIFCAIAPSYGLLMTARVITAFAHAAFFGIAAVVAADLVAPNRRASAIALVFAGLTVANIIGVPAGTALGQAYGWRMTFWTVSGIGVIAFAAVAFFVPAKLKLVRANIAAEFRVLARPQVLMAMSITVLTSASLFAVFTFIAPTLTDVTGIASGLVSWYLLAFGVGMTVGAYVGGRLADWKLMPSIVGITAVLGVVLLVLSITVHNPTMMLVTMFVWGLVVFSLAPSLQIRVVNTASDAPNVASTLNQAAFNLGNAGGAWIGSTALVAGLAYEQLPFVGIVLVIAALGVGIVSITREPNSPDGSPELSRAQDD